MGTIFHFDLVAFIQSAGYVGMFLIVFAESGLLIGFFFPGDSLLFVAGVLASQGYFDIFLLVPLVTAAAILGDSIGYAFGEKVGAKIFNREDSIWFHKKHLREAEIFFNKYGNITIILSRFTPIVRTFAPILAGVGRMRYRTFLMYNVLGALLWGTGMTLLGYYLGSIPGIDRYLLPIITFIILLSFLPYIVEYLRERKKRLKQ